MPLPVAGQEVHPEIEISVSAGERRSGSDVADRARYKDAIRQLLGEKARVDEEKSFLAEFGASRMKSSMNQSIGTGSKNVPSGSWSGVASARERP